MNQIDYTIEEIGNVYILKMRGEITAGTLPEYRKIIDSLMVKLEVHKKENLTFLMDYGLIRDVDSTALANIVERLNNDVREGHSVAYLNVPEKFKTLVVLHKLSDTIKIYDSKEEALRDISSTDK